MSSTDTSPSAALAFALVPLALLLPRLASLFTEDSDDVPSLLEEFSSLQLQAGCTIHSANGRRCASYSARKIPRVRAYKDSRGSPCSQAVLEEARRSELSDIMKWPRIGKSHRTCISMLDSSTASLLGSVREKIMSVYSASDDVKTKSMWIPAQNVIPVTDLHVTVATPWWWHTLTESHGEITSQMSSRLRQTLLLGMHHPFSIEVDTVTFAGSNLVVLWRTVGPRGDVTDRHSTERDPFVYLRREIARCFTTASSCGRREPLTHTSLAGKGPPTLKRHNTIEEKTPGMGEGDGFIHTTLARLPKSMSRYNVYNRDVVKGLCDEATKMLSGRRILINHIRFLHTTGLGGGSNPCVQPLFDETILLPEKKAGRTVGPVRDVERIGVKGILFDEEDGE